MKALQKTLGGAAALALVLSLFQPALAAGSGAGVTIYARESKSLQERMVLALYQRSGQKGFQFVDDVDFTTPVNRVTGDMEFQLIPEGSQTTLTVDYLTDLNGDGIYELVSGEDDPVGDALTADGSLAQGQSPAALTAGRTYTITGQTLLQRGEEAMKSRTTPGSETYLSQITPDQPRAEDIVYMLTVSGLSQGEELCYYFRLYDQLPTTSVVRDYLDVPAGSWYYEVVDYVLSNGLINGTSATHFEPNGTLSRGMLAQILYNLAGKPQAGESSFQDVPKSAWYYQAVSWAVEEGLLSGTADGSFVPNLACTREQAALVLFRFAQLMGADVSQRGTLSGFTDGQSVSAWAREAVQWAVAEGVLTGTGGSAPALRPGSSLSRAEFAAILRTMCENVLK